MMIRVKPYNEVVELLCTQRVLRVGMSQACDIEGMGTDKVGHVDADTVRLGLR
jgi:hypothetical protein